MPIKVSEALAFSHLSYILSLAAELVLININRFYYYLFIQKRILRLREIQLFKIMQSVNGGARFKTWLAWPHRKLCLTMIDSVIRQAQNLMSESSRLEIQVAV